MKEEIELLYRCNGKKCKTDDGVPICFYTKDPEYALHGFQPKVVTKDLSEEDLNKWRKECEELAEWQTLMPVDARMGCKKHLPVLEAVPDGGSPPMLEDGGQDGDVQP